MSSEKEKKASKSEKSPARASGRFLGFQKTPIHRAFFGRSTRSGQDHQEQPVKHSTGPVQKLKKQFYLLDASQLPVGRVASVAATLLMGKHKPGFTPGADSGDSVIVINASQAFFTSDKAERKIYYWHSGYPGGLKMETARDALQKHPDKVIWDAVRGMLPRNRISRSQIARLRVYKDGDHGQEAQKPMKIDLKEKAILKSIPLEVSAAS